MTTRGEKKSKRKKTTAAELPEELVRREILTRLPIKSAVRFKCVSKSWLSLYSNPQFVKQHLTYNTTQNPNDYDCLIAKKHDKIVILSRYKETFALTLETYLAFNNFLFIGAVRGLVCLRHNYKSKWLLWNPAIHCFKEFSVPLRHRHCAIAFSGFGYDPVSDNYKFVVVSRDLSFASVYGSNSDEWIDISVPNNVCLVQNREGTFLSTSISIVKDCPYWKFTTFVGSMREDVFSPATILTLVKFDTGTNEFKLLPEFHVAISVQRKGVGFGFEVVDMNDCLNLIVYDRNSSKCMLDVYSLDGEEGCCVWSKMYTIGPLDFHSRHWFVSQGFYGGGIVFYDDGMFSCYDDKTDKIKRLSTTSTTASNPSIGRCFKYTPSLLFLEGMKSVYLPSRPRRTNRSCSRVPQRLIKSLKD